MKIAVILPAAGKSKRFGDAGKSKLEEDLDGKPVFMRAVELFVDRDEVSQIILAVNPDDVDAFKLRYGDQLGFRGVEVIAGGTIERWETVRNGMNCVSGGTTHIAVHDAARPLASAAMIDRVFAAAKKAAAVVPGVDVNATLKRVGEAMDDDAGDDPLDAILGAAGKPQYLLRPVIETVDRSNLVEVQTPQVVQIDLLQRGFERLQDGEIHSAAVTDEACLVEAMGEVVHVVQGERGNLKITTPDDMEVARAVFASRGASEKQALSRKRLFADDDDD